MTARRLLRTLTLTVVTVLTLALLVGLGGITWLRHENRPASGHLTLTGLQGEVDITRDQYGVPHVRADTDTDVVFALGFLHWQDRSWQMEFQRRIAAGRLSEVLGETTLDQDRFLRTMGFRRVAEASLPALEPRNRALISAYTAGVNAAMAHTAPAPEFRILGVTPEPWTDVDAVSWSQLMSYDLAGNYVDETIASRAYAHAGQAGIDAFYPPYPQDAPTITGSAAGAGFGTDEQSDAAVSTEADTDSDDGSPAERAAAREEAAAIAAAGAGAVAAAHALGMAPAPGKGSNNWVVDGTRTVTGSPILAGDPHLGLSSPMLWYLADLRGETIRSIGASIPGLPAIVIGRTDTFAWAVTNVGADVQDLYVLPDDAQLTERVETIEVSGGDTVEHIVRMSDYGPVVSDVGVHEGAPDEPDAEAPRTLALRWVALDEGDTTMDAFLGLNRATTVAEGREALMRYVSPSQNFVLADTDGHIGYVAPGRLPLRHWEGDLPVPADGSHDWSGFRSDAQLPQVMDPPTGQIVTANHAPEPLTGDLPPVAGPRVWADPYRAQRILDLLGDRDDLDVAAMRAIQTDVHSGVFDDLRDVLLGTDPLDRRGVEALDRLRDWDGQVTTDSVEATIFEAWLLELRALSTDELGERAYTRPRAVRAQMEQGVFCPDATTGETTCEQALARTLSRALDLLTDRFGADMSRWTWGRAHDGVHRHGAFADVPLLGRVFNHRTPTAGGTDTLAPARPEPDVLEQRNGAGYRQIVDLADPDASRFVGSLGQGGSPWHPHATDFMPLWRDGLDIPMSTRDEDWGTTTRLTLSPR
ncbi:MAG: penicillin acylase family protein [Mobilicoccus sp.]|nr:penicillin acylase family protein [Mobilicoccus sp.]